VTFGHVVFRGMPANRRFPAPQPYTDRQTDKHDDRIPSNPSQGRSNILNIIVYHLPGCLDRVVAAPMIIPMPNPCKTWTFL